MKNKKTKTGKSKKASSKTIGWIFIVIGFILIVSKAIDYFVPGKALIPGSTLIGLLFVATGLLLNSEVK
jgi:hypothetical protein